VKLQSATRIFDIPTRTGIFCFNRKGARTGSRAMRSSIMRNKTAAIPAVQSDAITAGLFHYSKSLNVQRMKLEVKTYG
jgi:hypothetical protein